MNTAEYLTQLIDCKEDMKSAIIEQGVTPTGGLSTYADAIREIQWRQEGEIRYACNTWNYCPDIDISKYTSLDNMFRECVNLVEGPDFDTKNITDFTDMFYKCSSLTSVPMYDMSNAQSVYGMLFDCSSLTSVPHFNTSNVTDIGFMLQGCSSLTSVPHFNTSNVTRFIGTFWDCSSLTELPQYNMQNVTDVAYMCQNCTSLTSVPLLDFKNVTRVTDAFKDCNNLINLGGFKDFGAKKNLYSDGYYLNLTSCYKLTHESIMNVINNLYDRASVGYSVKTIRLDADTLALLSDEEKAIATNKGWTLS